ncbi:MAG: alpha-amylase family glycosyl hydrolase [Candidatus Eiseniibacteriota bacterium]
MNPIRATPNPHLLEISVRPWLASLGVRGSPRSLDAVPDEALDRFRERGFHAVWLMGVWRTGGEGRRLALHYPDLRAAYSRLLPDWTEEDVLGSPYSIQAYDAAGVGGDDALARFRARLHERDIGLVLDFVPNHLARDHPWTTEHPEHLVTGTADDLAREPTSWFEAKESAPAPRVFAHGRDPWFPGWTDTVQVDHRRSAARRAMTNRFVDVARRCDGVRCDVAMLVLEDIFQRTWGPLPVPEPGDFWTEAIGALHAAKLDTVLIAEAYWGLEPRLIALGFDFAYDKGLYDALLAGDVDAVRSRVESAAPEKGVHFLENHDEERARKAFGAERIRAAAAVTYSLPGTRFFHEGQAEGRELRLPVQLARDPGEPVREDSLSFHRTLWRLLADPLFHAGRWAPLEVRPVLPGDPRPPLVGSVWSSGEDFLAVVANLATRISAGRLVVPLPDGPARVGWTDELNAAAFETSRSETREAGLLMEVPPGGARFLRLRSG